MEISVRLSDICVYGKSRRNRYRLYIDPAIDSVTSKIVYVKNFAWLSFNCLFLPSESEIIPCL